MHILLTALIAGLGTAARLPNTVGVLGSGLNVFTSNPQSPDGVDPGLRNNVVDVTKYNENAHTADGRYELPDGVTALEASVCSTRFSTTTVTTSSAYQQLLTTSVKGHGAIYVASFSGSADFQSRASKLDNASETLVVSTARCSRYKVRLVQYSLPALTDDFGEAVASLLLPHEDPSNATMAVFLRTFGTHYVSAAMLGGELSVQWSLSEREYASWVSSSVKIETAASFGARSLSLGAGGSGMTLSETSLATKFRLSAQQEDVRIIGGVFPADGSVSTWALSVSNFPAVMSVEIRPLEELLTAQLFPNDANIAAKQAMLAEAVAQYCTLYAAKEGVYCQPVKAPTRAAAAASSFGGMYQVDDCGGNSVTNPYTGLLSCGPNHTPVHVGRLQAAETKCGAMSVLCLGKADGGRDPLGYFGGVFQVADVGTANNFPNPITGAYTCEAGYAPVAIGRVRTAETHAGANQYMCVNVSSGISPVAAGYQCTDNDASYSKVTNVHTVACSCPGGYLPYARGRVKTPDGSQSGATQFLCLSNVY